MEDFWLGNAIERVFLPLLQATLPEIRDLHMPAEGIFNNLVLVSIQKRYPGHAKKVMHALWGLGQMMFTKVIVVVDHWVNVQDARQVAWLAMTNTDPGRDCAIVEGPVDNLNHAAPLLNLGTKIGIDATEKWASEGYGRDWPERIEMSADIVRRVEERWSSYDL
jgi:4-hydroxy-3-polyprenylbenzoate decarboxylase